MVGLAISGAINLIEGDWTNLNVHVPAQIALLCAMCAMGAAQSPLRARERGAARHRHRLDQRARMPELGLRDPAMIAYPAILAFASTMGGLCLILFYSP